MFLKRLFEQTLFFALLVTSLLATPTNARAQANKLPPFRMVQTNGKLFKAEDLPMGKPIIIVYFSPECEHCEIMLKEFFGDASRFQNASIVMMTYLTQDKVAKFEKDYPVKNWANIYSGTEGTSFFVRDYYKIKEMPFAALYTKDGNLVKSYERTIVLKELAQALKQLK